MSDWVIQTHGLTRYFGSKCAVDQVTLSVPRGSVFAMLGRNGSGKSTIMRMLLGMLEPTRGSATVFGEDCRNLTPATRGRIGFVPEGHPLIDWMRISELESFQKTSYPRWNAKIFRTVIDHFGLTQKARAWQLSRGQRAGLSLALVLATEPELLVMDDPALGLDPVARRTLLEAMILLTRDAGHTIFFCSHILDDVERVAEHVAIIDRSVLRVSAPIETFRARIKRLVLSFAGNAPPPLPPIPGLLQARRERNELRLTLANFNEQTQHILDSLGAVAINEVPVSFEEAVIGYLGERGEKPDSSSSDDGNGGGDMNAIVIKELKENLKWAVLLLLGMSIAMYMAVSNSDHLTFVNEVVFIATVGGFSAAGLALGLLQVFQDQWKGRYAFVMHRPTPASTIFWGKVLAGLTLYVPVTAIPFLAAALWAAMPGNMPAPFDWHMTVPGIWDLINGVTWYFAGMLVGSRTARWFGSRLMPLGCAFVFTAAGLVYEMSFGSAMIITSVSLLILIPAAWGSFVYSVAPDRQPGFLRVCQTLVVTIGIFIALAAACSFSTEWLRIALPSSRGGYSWYLVDKTGRPLRVDYISDRDGSNLYDLQGQPAGKIPPGRNYAEELYMTYIPLPAEAGARWPRLGFHQRERYTVEVYGLEHEDWFYLVNQSVFVGYDAHSHRQIGQIGVDGFVPAPQAAQPFSEPLDMYDLQTGRGPYYDRTHVYTINLARRELRTIFTTTADDPVFRLNTFSVSNESEAQDDLRGPPLRDEYTVVSTEKKLHVIHNGAELFSFVSPVAREDYYGLYMGKVINGPFMLRSYSGGGARPQQLMELNDQGAIVKQMELPLLPVNEWSPPWWDSALSGFALSPMPSSALLFIYGRNAVRPRLLNVFTIAFANLAALMALLYARRYTLATRAKAVWGSFTLLFGAAGLLGMLSMRDTPARVRCPSCGKLRMVTRQHCEHCNAEFPAPERQGIEVFE